MEKNKTPASRCKRLVDDFRSDDVQLRRPVHYNEIIRTNKGQQMAFTTDLWAWRKGNSDIHIGGKEALAADAGHTSPLECAPATRATAPDAFAEREAEVASLRSILPQRLLDQERHAAFTRWHGYRFMSAMECTWQFARDYEAQFSISYGMRCRMRPEFGSKDFEVLWEMRQAADDMLISYPLYLEISFQPVRNRVGPFAEPHLVFARHQRGTRWLKLYNKRLAEHWAIDFRRAADLPQFHLANDHGLPNQKRFRQDVGASKKVHEAVEQARKYALERRIVPVSDALGRLSDEDRREAVERLKLQVATGQVSRRPDPEPLEAGQLIQSCYGWGWRNRKEEHCHCCIQKAGCDAAQQRD